MEEVIEVLGEPITINSGNLELSKIEFLYQVRTNMVKSKLFKIPNKNNLITLPSQPLFGLIIVFENSKLVSWCSEKLLMDKSTLKFINYIEPILVGGVWTIVISAISNNF